MQSRAAALACLKSNRVSDVIDAAKLLVQRSLCAELQAVSEASENVMNLRCIEAPDAALLLDLLAQVLGFKTH
jgi:hypothetical protein